MALFRLHLTPTSHSQIIEARVQGVERAEEEKSCYLLKDSVSHTSLIILYMEFFRTSRDILKAVVNSTSLTPPHTCHST